MSSSSSQMINCDWFLCVQNFFTTHIYLVSALSSFHLLNLFMLLFLHVPCLKILSACVRSVLLQTTLTTTGAQSRLKYVGPPYLSFYIFHNLLCKSEVD